MTDAERAGLVQSVVNATSGTLRTLDPNLLCLVLLVAMTLGVLAYATEQHRSYQHSEMMALIQACLAVRGLAPNPYPGPQYP